MSQLKSYPFTAFLCLSIFILRSQASAQKPTISSFSPTKGNIGTTVTISGNNFSAVSSNNVVYFGDVKASVSNATATSLTVTVPAGASYKPISITTNNLTAYSSIPFDVIFPGDGNGFTDKSFTPAMDSSWGFTADYVGATDLDGDGDLDPVLVNANSDFIAILKNNSSIGSISLTYSTSLKFSAGDSSTHASFGDFDGDGKQDIVVVNSKGNSLSVFKNNSTIDLIQLLPKVDLATASLPAFSFVSDVDNDGKPDIVCTNSGSNSVSFFRNTSAAGIISFAPRIDIATGKKPYGLTVADIDGENLPDLVVANVDDYSVSIFKNNSTPGTISFGNRTNISNLYASRLVTADLDDDGKPDLITTTNFSAFVNVIRNASSTGNFSFAPVQQFQTGFGTPTVLAVGDIDGDGKPDLAVNHDQWSRISVLKNLSQSGNISFSSNADLLTTAMSLTLLLTDLDNDARPDIISGNRTLSALSTFRNLVPKPIITSISPTTGGNGKVITITGNNFLSTSQVSLGGSPASSFIVQSSTTISAVADTGSTGDVTVTTAYGTAKFTGFNFSKVPTVTSFNPTKGGSGTIVTITGTNLNNVTSVNFGNAAASSFTIVSPTTITATVGSISAGNYDVSVTNAFGTGPLGNFYTGVTIDSFYPTSGPVGTNVTINGTHFSSTLSDNIVYFGPVRATVFAATSTSLSVLVPAGANYQPITVTVNNLTAYSIQPFTVTFKGTGNEFTTNSFGDRVDTTAGDFPAFELIVDLNGDGKPDIVSSNSNSLTVSVNKNISSGGATSFQRKVDYTIGSVPHGSCSGDLDGDGKPEIVVLQAQKGVSLDRSFTIFKNVSTIDTILLSTSEYTLPNLDAELQYAVINDFDGDGKPDVAVLSRSVSVLRNTSSVGSISFAPRVDLGMLSATGTAISIADVDGDGKMDIVATGQNSDYVYVFRNLSMPGQISFARYVAIGTGFSPTGLGLGDLGNDGKPDMVVSNGGNNNISTYKNLSTPGVIAFEPRVNYQLGLLPRRLSIGDLDGDGRLDIAFVSLDQFVYVMKNTSLGGTISFADKTGYSDPYGPIDVSIADMNNDGKQDLIAGNYTTSMKFSVIVNKCQDDGLAVAPITAQGPTEFCQGGNVLLKTSSVNGASYQWYKDGAAITSATDSVFTANVAGIYSVKITNNGIVSTSGPVNVSVKSIPSAPVLSVTGSGTICQGTATVLHSSIQAGIAWYKDNVLTNIADSVYRVSTAGTYKLIANSNGCLSPSSNEITISVNPAPSATITASANALCEGSDSITLTANNGNGYAYQWNINDEQLPGTILSSLITKNAGNFSVTENSNGCSATSKTIAISKNPSPPKPVITLVGADLKSSAQNGNQWFKDGVAIASATSQTYTPAGSSNYSVQVTQNGCKSTMSDAYVFVVTAVVSIDNTHFIKLSPNPVQGQMIIDFNLNGIYQLNINLIDLNGRVIKSWKNQRSGGVLNISESSKSIYLARIFSSNGKIVSTLKLIKQ